MPSGRRRRGRRRIDWRGARRDGGARERYGPRRGRHGVCRDRGAVLTWLTGRFRRDRSAEPSLKPAQVVHDIPAVHVLDAIIRGHETAAVADDAVEVAIAAILRDVGKERRRRQAVRGDQSITRAGATVAYRAIDLVVAPSVGE